MSRRRLSDEERALWKGVTRSIAPLRPTASATEAEAETAPPPAPLKSRARVIALPAAPVAVLVPAVPAPLAPFGRRTKQRIARGRDAIDGRLDLHGMTQAEAHSALFGFLRARQARGARFVLVITGKGASGDAYAGRGMLKRLVPLWLRLPEFRSLIVGFENAAVGHGGDGALYISLRRPR